jgi:putative addiction module CopG family antidote
MAIEQLNISLTPQMAQFIRRKVEAGEYADESEVVIDAIRRVQAAEEVAQQETLDRLSDSDRRGIRDSVQAGLRDLQNGDYTEYDEDGLRRIFADVIERGKKGLAPQQSPR